MYQTFESDVMEDLLYEEAEGPARHHADGFEEFELGEAAYDGFADEFDGFEAMEDWADTDAYAEEDVIDGLEDAVADALGADDTDEFFRRLARGIRNVARGAVRVARPVAPVVGRIARTVAPIASAIPLPWTQAIGRVAGVVGRLTADEADEFEALDEMFDFAEDEGAIDAAAPVIAGLTIRSTMPGVSRLPRPARRQLVHSVTQATRTIARRQGPQAARAVTPIVRSVQRAAQQRRLPARAVPATISRTAARVARSPQTARRLAARAGAAVSAARRGTGCPTCGRAGCYTLRGPVTISIRGH
jgi:hypothetical protein